MPYPQHYEAYNAITDTLKNDQNLLTLATRFAFFAASIRKTYVSGP
jgi:hypothetical protein